MGNAPAKPISALAEAIFVMTKLPLAIPEGLKKTVKM